MGHAIEKLSGANWWFLGLVFLLANGDRFLMAYKWNLLLRVKGIQLPLVAVAGSYYRATFAGFFLPTPGADALRTYEVSLRTRRFHDVLPSVVVERTLGLIALFLLGVVSVALFVTQFNSVDPLILPSGALITAVLLAAFIISLRYRGVGQIREDFKRSNSRAKNSISRILDSYQDYSRHGMVLAAFFGLSFIEQLVPIASAFLVSRALDLQIPWLVFVIFVPLITAFVRLPLLFAIDGFGVSEWLYVYFFGLIGLGQTQACLLAFLDTLCSFWRSCRWQWCFFLVGKGDKRPSGIT